MTSLVGKLAPYAARTRTPALTTSGLGMIDWGLWTLHPAAGMIGIGVTLLILEWLTAPAQPSR